MIEIASPATPQLSSLSPLVVRPRRRRSPEDAPGAYREHDCREKHDSYADREWLFATLHPPKLSSIAVPAVRRRRPFPLKSP
jgi:hypothetical protein